MMAWRNFWIVRWLRQNVSEPLVAVFQMGAEPKTLAMSGALGVTMGIFPIYGVTALICACAIAILGARCNPPTMMIANLIATPLELSLIIPFLRLGEFIVQGEHIPLSRDAIWKALTGQASWDVVIALFHATLGWMIVAPLIVVGLYFILLPVMRFSIQRYAPEPAEDHLEPLVKDPSV